MIAEREGQSCRTEHTPCLITALRQCRLYDWKDALAQVYTWNIMYKQRFCHPLLPLKLFPTCKTFSMEHERRYFEIVVVALFHAIVPLYGAWLAGDLTNHKAESTILSDKQTRQESRLTLVDLNLKKGVCWCLSMVKIKHVWCSFIFISFCK